MSDSTPRLRAIICATLFAASSAALADEGVSLDEIVVTGTRRADVKATDSLQPVDVISGNTLRARGASNLNDLLRSGVPSFNAQQFVQQDGSAFVRPFSLRGLAPDQSLVLVNGKRRHRAALVQITNQPLASGAQGPDLATIPSIAVERLELLRDGAAAQYGSDAIAGVLNINLKRAAEGLTFATRFGQYYAGDGRDVDAQVNFGVPLAGGFVNVSGQYANSDPTRRERQRPDAQALIDAGNTAVPSPAQRWGNIDSQAQRVFVNAELPAGDRLTTYLFANWSKSEGETAFGYRSPNARPDIFASVPLTREPGGGRFSFRAMFPGGFTPMFGTRLEDGSITAGARGGLDSGLTWDLSGAVARNEIEYRIRNTVNPSLGPDSPTAFNPGTIQQREEHFNADFAWPIELAALASPLNVAFGAEHRRETFEIRAGDPASYQVGPFARVVDPDTGGFTGLAVASSGFPGYTPQSAGTFSGSSNAAYLDIESDVSDRLALGLAGRYEDYSEFGDQVTGKISARYALNESVATRASASTGFRAPTPGQANISDLATNINIMTGDLLLTATRAPYDPVAGFYGAQPLRSESSRNLSLGFVVNVHGWRVSLDAFRIDVDDRIALTSRIAVTAADRAAMAAAGIDPGDVQSVRYFGNFFDTRTRGADLVAAREWTLDGATLAFDAAINYTENEVTRVRDARAVDRERRIEIGAFNPRWRGNLAGELSNGRWSALVRTQYYGEWTDAVPNATPTALAFDQTFGDEWLVDLRASYALSASLELNVGADNVLDAYPDADRRQGQINNGIVYPQFSPFGFSGAFWYAGATLTF
jgi:iron complex outermembrane recepter protein